MNQLAGAVGDLVRTLTYQEFPNQFVIESDPNNSQSKAWHVHQRNGLALGRMTYVGPTAGERFYLCLLLMVVKGPISFEDLKMVNGHICNTFHEACLKRNLLEDDSKWQMCLQDATKIQTGAQL